jgi:site-specific recombinase XerD
MSRQWRNTKFPGVRFREHSARKHGIQKDRYFAIRYQRESKRHEEGVGWTSEGWTAEKAANELAELKKAHTLGTGGPTRLIEKRQVEKERREQKRLAKERQEREAVTFNEYFEKIYLPAQTHKKRSSTEKEEGHIKNWINPAIGALSFKEIKPIHIERLKKILSDASKAPRTVQYILATFRQVWNMARRDGLVMGESPTKQVRIPKFDNQRTRFLSHAEADALLENLQLRDLTMWRMALLSLHTGMRAGEIFSLIWGHVDLGRGLILIVDAKGQRRRAAFMTGELEVMFEKMQRRGPTDSVFTQKDGGPFLEMPNTFETTIKALKFNAGITDRRERVSFHTLRHSFASWHAESGTDLYIIKELLGHGTIKMTERYSHLSPEALQNAVKTFERSLNAAKQDKGNVVELRKQE